MHEDVLVLRKKGAVSGSGNQCYALKVSCWYKIIVDVLVCKQMCAANAREAQQQLICSRILQSQLSEYNTI